MKKRFAIALLLPILLNAYAAGESITVYKDPSCGCCEEWIKHLRESGYKVHPVDTANMSALKKRLNVPEELASCHTGVVDRSGQMIEGHVPAKVVAKMIAAPRIKGLAVPGMPLNSPGMGSMDGKLVTVDFQGKLFSTD